MLFSLPGWILILKGFAIPTPDDLCVVVVATPTQDGAAAGALVAGEQDTDSFATLSYVQ